MQKIVQFDGTDTNKEQIKQENSTLYPIEERDWFADITGTTRAHYLVFSDTKPVSDQLQDIIDNTNIIIDKQKEAK